MSRLLVDGNETEAWQLWNKLKWIFDDVFMEVQSHDTPDQAEANAKIAAFIKKYNLPYTITTDAHMLSKEDVDAHSVFVEIGEGREVGESYVDCYLQTEDDVLRTLSKQFDEDFIKKGCEMSVKIADMIDDIDIGLGQPNQMPEVKIEGKFDSHFDYLRHLVYATFNKKFGWMSEVEQQTRRNRIEMELDVLKYVDYIDYFIMLYMLCKKADERKIPRGYSRGSGANCLCLFMENVTQIDSVRWDLDFSRFANKGRKSLADFDFDVSKRRRKELIAIAEELFGKENVAPIATFNSLSTKVAIKDIKLRTFIAEGNSRNDLAAHVYDITYGSLVSGVDNLVIIDDSIVRGTTLKQSIIGILDRLGPKKIVIVSSSPQVRYPDYYGIDMAKMSEFIAFKAAIELLKDRDMKDVIAAAYRKSKDQVGLPKEQMVNYVKDIYAPFTDEEISAKMVELLTPAGTKAKVEIVYQPLEGLHEACPNHRGDWYFSGDYPTPGGVKMLNNAFIDYIEQVYQF